MIDSCWHLLSSLSSEGRKSEGGLEGAHKVGLPGRDVVRARLHRGG